ncbi:DUF4181 domain-containing protein [Paenibacillus tuaregi]|uniref:DUF4181 domain-containing protein n=1 Tax=Paenibacillus tuaregi TaxID=1816681 RepID=UPI0008390F9F|nr:DUF4181 domain-containing protein [Paenibacillus tuaregi]
MGNTIMSAIIITIVISRYFLRRWIVGTNEKEELPRIGRKVETWGLIILALIGITTCIVLLVEDTLKGNTLKWFFILFITITAGFRTFVDWKYLRDSKEYMVSLIVLILGVTLVFSLL